ncbi:hypothetical protein AB0D60_10670 [Streptomyces sp. NPDC048306]|uniref:hypothetical protein n=1 Tax=Streptomyces sp. NPDC048306 TaxID=3154502 RepID=UPI0033D0725D
MTKTRFSHAACDHASTKAARAKCRKEMRGEAVASTVAAPKPVAVTPTKKKDPRKVAAAPKPAAVVTVETPTADESAPAQPKTPAPAEPQEVTRETWRDFKDQRVTVHVVGVEEPFTNLELTGWSIKLIQFKDAEGKSHRLPVTTVEKVTTV